MKITQKIVTVSGGKEAEIALSAELKTIFQDAPIHAYQAAGQLEKAAKNAKKSFLPEDRLKVLIKKHKKAIEESKHFTEEGLDCYIRKRMDYNFEVDSKYKALKQAVEIADAELEAHKKELIAKNLVPSKSVTYIFGCCGEKFQA